MILWAKHRWSTETSIKVHRDTQLVSSGIRIWTQEAWVWTCMPQHGATIFLCLWVSIQPKTGKVSCAVLIVRSQCFEIWTQIFWLPFSFLLTGDVGILHIIEMSAPTFLSQDQISLSCKHCPWSLKLNRWWQVPSISPKVLLVVFILDGGINNTLIFSVNNWSKLILTSEPCFH